MADEMLCALQGVSKSYDGKTTVLKDLDLGIEQGELITCLGPSGSGKTTTLMLLAGFEAPDKGEIYFRGKPVSQTVAYKRNFGVVFQNYALFPHMSVAENIAFPLKMRRMGKAEIGTRVGSALDMIQMRSFADRKPGQLSGGQQQRVALARALVFQPDLVLLDEPLAALDKNLREQLQFEIRALHKSLGITMLYVTHDQGEALTLSDRVAVFRNGSIEQLSRPEELYQSPRTRFVADFIGKMNFLPGRMTGRTGEICDVTLEDGTVVRSIATDRLAEGDRCEVAVRPEWLKVGTPPASANVIRGPVSDIVFQGDNVRVQLKLAQGPTVLITMHLEDVQSLRVGNRIEVWWPYQVSHCFRAED